MKLIFLIASLCPVFFVHAQTQDYPVKGQLVHVRDWGEHLMIPPEQYWNNGTDQKSEEITRQIGAEEFEQVKIYSQQDSLPCEFRLICGDYFTSKIKSLDSLKMRLSQLRVYKIATYAHINNTGDTSHWAVLRVPGSENRAIPVTGPWDTVYFFVPEEQVY